jgi:hypothetical protein
MENGTATLEDSLAVSNKTKHISWYLPPTFEVKLQIK